MLVDLKVNGKTVVVVGSGSEGYRKTCDFLQAGAKVHVISRSFSEGIAQLGKERKICLKKETVEDAAACVNSFDPKPDIFVAVTSNHELNAQLIKCAKDAGCLIYAPDNPALSDFLLPAVAKVGEVQIAISTSGKSPAMASVLRKRIEKMITFQDLLQIELQDFLRGALKQSIPDQKVRRERLYAIIQNVDIQALLKQGKLDEAKEEALEIAES